MITEILHNIAFRPDFDALCRELHLKRDSPPADELARLLAEAGPIARPKALYRLGQVQSCTDSTVVIEGIPFASRVLAVNLKPVNRVFAFVATCGVEIEAWSQTIEGTLRRFLADAVKEAALSAATEALQKHLDARYRPGPLGMMNPGSLDDWPTSAQPDLFRLVGDTRRTIGVELLDSCIMSPIKSVSGIFFPTEAGFESCRLCPMKNCPKRRAPYDEALWEQKYRCSH